MLHLHPEVKAKFDQFVYASSLVLIVLFAWTSFGLSMLTQSQNRMATASWHFHVLLAQWSPLTPTETWGLLWLLASLLVGLACLRGLRALQVSLYLAAVVPASWVVLFVLAAVRDGGAGLTGVTAYAALALLAFVTGKGLSGVSQ